MEWRHLAILCMQLMKMRKDQGKRTEHFVLSQVTKTLARMTKCLLMLPEGSPPVRSSQCLSCGGHRFETEFSYWSIRSFVLYEMLKTDSNFNINTTDISCIIYNTSSCIWCLPLLLLTDSRVQHSVGLWLTVTPAKCFKKGAPVFFPQNSLYFF